MSDAALGDPLIKGLTEVANQRPENPIIFLANFLLNYANQGKQGNQVKKIGNSRRVGNGIGLRQEWKCK